MTLDASWTKMRLLYMISTCCRPRVPSVYSNPLCQMSFVRDRAYFRTKPLGDGIQRRVHYYSSIASSICAVYEQTTAVQLVIDARRWNMTLALRSEKQLNVTKRGRTVAMVTTAELPMLQFPNEYYNCTKGGVDSLDQKCANYSSSRQTCNLHSMNQRCMKIVPMSVINVQKHYRTKFGADPPSVPKIRKWYTYLKARIFASGCDSIHTY
ncbi:hypothetical protein ANN_18461 [Periplaneta americana]|uniref:DUF4817 domain-containing protein n=1 Tax=Periplaneta americana TaxID=6978 RepID=A0ABQ8SQ62_PERAM|nr:hypothetical protein ANN_18461 [Periplaneta americana]